MTLAKQTSQKSWERLMKVAVRRENSVENRRERERRDGKTQRERDLFTKLFLFSLVTWYRFNQDDVNFFLQFEKNFKLYFFVILVCVLCKLFVFALIIEVLNNICQLAEVRSVCANYVKVLLMFYFISNTCGNEKRRLITCWGFERKVFYQTRKIDRKILKFFL